MINCPICNEIWGTCKHNERDYIEIINRAKKIVEESIDYEGDFQPLPYKKVRELYDILKFQQPTSWGSTLRDMEDLKRDEDEKVK